MLEIRVHHLLGFTQAIISEELRNKFINGFYSEEQYRKIINFLQSLTDSTLIRVVTGTDSICDVCPCKSEDCEFPDSVWDAKEFMYIINPNEIMTITYLKEQYELYQRVVRKVPNWKSIIVDSRKNYLDL